MDGELLERLYRKWLEMAERCSSWAGADAEEAASEALDVAMKKSLKEEQAIGVFRTCLMRVRSRQRRKEETLIRRRQRLMIAFGYDQPKNAACEEVNPEELQQVIARLTPRDQRVICLRYFNGRKNPTPYAMIGRQEGLSGERIRQLLQRIHDRLRTLLERD